MTSERRANAISVAILALLPTLLFADILLGINSFYTRDITYYYFPAKKLLRDIALGGHFPYWNPYFSAGQPLAANPEHEVFYPLTWLILLPRYDLAFHLLIVAHVYITTFAMYAFLRSLGLGRPASVVGALSSGLGGAVLSTLNLLPYLFSFAWLPLTCLYGRRYLRSRTPRDLALAAFFLGLQLIIGEPTTAMQSGIILGIYALYRGFHDAGAWRHVARVALISVLALLLSAAQVLPALDHFRDSVRTRGFDFQTVSYWSTPVARLAELIYPNVFGSARIDGPYLYWGARLYANEARPYFLGMYAGLLAGTLLLAGIAARVRGAGLAIAIGATSFVFAAGSNTPLLRMLFDSGIANWLRYPEKFVLMGLFATVAFAAVVLDRLLAGDARVRRAALAVATIVTSIAAIAWLFASTSAYTPFFRRVWALTDADAVDAMLALSRRGWMLASLKGVLLILLLRNVERVRRPLWLALLGTFIMLDLGGMIPDLAPRVPSSFHRVAPAVERTFPPDRDTYRVFHQAGWNENNPAGRFYRRPHPDLYWIGRNALSPMMPAAYRLRMAMDVDFDLTHLLATADFTESAWELSGRRPYDWGDVVASMSNIRYVGIFRDPREAMAMAEGDMKQLQPVRFIERPDNPRYYFADAMAAIRDRHDFVETVARTRDPRRLACVYGGAFAPARGVVRNWSETPNGARIDVECAGRAFLVMSVTPHKYWRIAIDGEDVQPLITNVGYQGVAVPAGRHVVTMEYRNPLVVAGGAISLATLLGLFVLLRPDRSAVARRRAPA